MKNLAGILELVVCIVAFILGFVLVFNPNWILSKPEKLPHIVGGILCLLSVIMSDIILLKRNIKK